MEMTTVAMIPLVAFFSVLICRRWKFIDDNDHRSIVASVINQIAIVRVLNTTKARSLQIVVFVVVGSSSHPAKILVVRPARIEIKSIKDEARKSNAHGFDRSVRWDKIKQLSVFPTIPKMKIIMAKYRFNCFEI